MKKRLPKKNKCTYQPLKTSNNDPTAADLVNLVKIDEDFYTPNNKLFRNIYEKFVRKKNYKSDWNIGIIFPRLVIRLSFDGNKTVNTIYLYHNMLG